MDLQKITTWIGVVAAGHSAKRLSDWTFDYVLYPLAILQFGPFWGGTIMAVAAFGICYAIIRGYDWLNVDLWGIEAIRNLKGTGEETGIFRRVVAWALGRGDGMAFVVLTLVSDPTMAVIYLRDKRETYNGLTARDWRIFIASWALGNVFWTAMVFFGIELGSLIWDMW